MQTKQAKKKAKKINRINKKNIGLTLIYLRALKIFKVLFTVLVIALTIYLTVILYKNSAKLKKGTSLAYSKLIYNNICGNIEINGVSRADTEKIQNDIYEFCNLEDKNDMNPLLNKINEDPWVKDITIKRKLPNTLEIQIEEYLPFAIWKNGNRLHLIDENGEIIKISEREKRSYYNLLIVAGEGSKENIYSLFNLLASNPSLFSRIKSALRIGERRWNLELDNGIIIKMPEKDALDAWNRLDKLLSIKGSEIDLTVIDLRNKDKIFLEEIK